MRRLKMSTTDYPLPSRNLLHGMPATVTADFRCHAATMSEDLRDLKLKKQAGNEDNATPTPETAPNAERGPSRISSTAIITVRPSWHMLDGENRRGRLVCSASP